MVIAGTEIGNTATQNYTQLRCRHKCQEAGDFTCVQGQETQFETHEKKELRPLPKNPERIDHLV